ncbi:MAG: sugar-binding protein [Deltaproteobacteria bacterium]|nr:sugar-binding protein [Deltaproteobacteria bacterium]
MRWLPAKLVLALLGVSGFACSPSEETVLRLDVENLSPLATGLRISLNLSPPRQFEATLLGRSQRVALPLGDTRAQDIDLGLVVLNQGTALGELHRPFFLPAGISPPVRLLIDQQGRPWILPDGSLIDAAIDVAASEVQQDAQDVDASTSPDGPVAESIRPLARVWSRAGPRPVIDGHADAVWMNALARGYDFPHFIVEEGAALPMAVPKARWAGLRDELGLYLFVQVQDDSIVVDGTKGVGVPDDGKAPWEDDSIEIFLDGDQLPATGVLDDINDSALQVRFGESLVRGPFSDTVSRVVPVPGYQVAWQRNSHGYSFEAFFPAQQLGVPTTPGRSILMDLHVNDDDAGDMVFTSAWKLAWASDRNQTFNNKQLWGQAVFMPEALQPLIEVPRMAAPLIDGDANEWPAFRWPLNHVFPAAASPMATHDLHAELALGQDESSLYLVIEVTDDVTSIQDFHPWFDDVVEIVVLPQDPTANASQAPATRLFFRPNATKVAQPPYHNTNIDTERVAFAWRAVSPTRRRLEVALPWSLWAGNDAQGAFGLDVVVWDDDQGDGIAANRVGWMSVSEVPAVGPFPRRLLGTVKRTP